MWFRDARVGGKTIKNYFNKKQDTDYLWQGERETRQEEAQEGPLQASFLILVLGDGYMKIHFELFLTVHRYLTYSLTSPKVLFHNSKNKQNKTHIQVSGGLDARSGLPLKSCVTQIT